VTDDAIGEAQFVGGLREGGNASRPLMRLTVTGEGVVIEPAWRAVALIAPTYRLPWDAIEAVHELRGITRSPGMRFELRRPVPAVRRRAVARLWPAAATAPIFWVRPDDLDRLREALKPWLGRPSTA
jgi:hypothetical protein